MGHRLGIAIVGAGIGGLAAAALLARRGHEVTVFDRFDRPRPVGSGLVIQPVGQAVLDEIGCGPAAMALGAPITRMLGHEAGGWRVLDVSYGPGVGLGIHRAALFSVLYEAARAAGAGLASGTEITGRDGQWLLGRDARHGPFDLIVDAAGARSPLSPLVASQLPYGAIWGTVDWPETTLPRDRLEPALSPRRPDDRRPSHWPAAGRGA